MEKESKKVEKFVELRPATEKQMALIGKLLSTMDTRDASSVIKILLTKRG